MPILRNYSEYRVAIAEALTRDSMNDLPYESEYRRELVTLESSPNEYLPPNSYGEIYVDEFAIDGSPLLFSFRAMMTNGRLAAKVRLGHTRDVEYRNGKREGAYIASPPPWMG